MIPYTVARRPDTGVTNVALGIWLFLSSEAMLFGALFSAYALLRTAAPVWPSGRSTLNVTIGAINTCVLVAGTLAIWRARRSDRPRVWLVANVVLGLLFLGLKGLEYRTEIVQGFLPAVSTFFAVYYTLTGIHAIHVLGGVIAGLWAMSGTTRAGALTSGRLDALTKYWAFVDLVWLLMFVLLYLS